MSEKNDAPTPPAERGVRLADLEGAELYRKIARINREEAEMAPAWRDRCEAEAEACDAYADMLERDLPPTPPAERGEDKWKQTLDEARCIHVTEAINSKIPPATRKPPTPPHVREVEGVVQEYRGSLCTVALKEHVRPGTLVRVLVPVKP